MVIMGIFCDIGKMFAKARYFKKYHCRKLQVAQNIQIINAEKNEPSKYLSATIQRQTWDISDIFMMQTQYITR